MLIVFWIICFRSLLFTRVALSFFFFFFKFKVLTGEWTTVDFLEYCLPSVSWE